jgi:exopolysaccharide biosynthesis polyprenyl glycosylphosphotransferase
VALALLELTAGYLALYFFLPRNALPRLFYLFFAVVAMISVTMWRWAYATLFTLPPLRRRILIVGAGWAGRVLAQALVNQEQADYHVVGFVDDDPAKQGTKVAGLPVLGGSAEMLRLVRRYRVDDVVLAITHELRGELFQALLDCQAVGVHMIHMPDLYEQLTRQVPVEHVDEGWVLGALNGFPSPGHLERAARRLLDLFCGSLGLIGLGCLLPFICLAIYLDDGGPVFYTQVRAGLGGRPFRVIKFRTMRTDAEPDGRPRWAREGDDRATRVGRILRKTRLDELPQVINILRGEMSVVGPRPERPEFIAELEKQIPFYRARLVVKPGLTGWAQIHYGYGNSVKDALIKLQYDLYYIRHRSLWLDLYVIFKTVGVVLRGSGI